MSLSVGQVRLQEAYKELRIKWTEARSIWDDKMARDFEKEYIAPLERHIRGAVQGMEDLGERVWQARRDCEP